MIRRAWIIFSACWSLGLLWANALDMVPQVPQDDILFVILLPWGAGIVLWVAFAFIFAAPGRRS